MYGTMSGKSEKTIDFFGFIPKGKREVSKKERTDKCEEHSRDLVLPSLRQLPG